MSTTTQCINDTNSTSSHDNNEIYVYLCEGNVGRHGLSHGLLYQYQGFWRTAKGIENVKDFQQNFKASHTDLIIATLPKSGTIWLKALVFAIINRSHYPCSSSSSEIYHQHPLLTISPHDLVPFVDFKQLYPDNSLLDFTKNSTTQDSPCRLIATHIPYPSLPESIKTTATNCKIVYLCRNPLDNFISLWLFMNKVRVMPMLNNNNASLSMEEAFEFFCDGVQEFGPYWDHVLGYWKESLKNPHKLLFVKYEDLKKEPKAQITRIAEFIGYGFSLEEENQGVIEEISSLCSFENLKNLDVNKNGTWRGTVENNVFFRKGE
ncbi:hypothetical protein MKW92_032443, partial [Papaver armeniacum]